MSKTTLSLLISTAAAKNDYEFIRSYTEVIDIIDPRTEKTPLYSAAEKGNNEAVKILLSKGAKVDFSYGLIGSVLHIAAYNGHAEVVQTILEHHKGLVNLLNSYGETPAYSAVFSNRGKEQNVMQVIQILKNFGADFNLKSWVGNDNIIQRAYKSGYISVIKFLQEEEGIGTISSLPKTPILPTDHSFLTVSIEEGLTPTSTFVSPSALTIRSCDSINTPSISLASPETPSQMSEIYTHQLMGEEGSGLDIY